MSLVINVIVEQDAHGEAVAEVATLCAGLVPLQTARFPVRSGDDDAYRLLSIDHEETDDAGPRLVARYRHAQDITAPALELRA